MEEKTADVISVENGSMASESTKGLNYLLMGAICVCSGMLGAFLYSSLVHSSASPSFVTISVTKVIESQAKIIDSEMVKNNTVLTDKQVQDRVEKYTQRISDALADYSKKNKAIVFEKGAIISDGFGVKDITDEFIKAVNE